MSLQETPIHQKSHHCAPELAAANRTLGVALIVLAATLALAACAAPAAQPVDTSSAFPPADQPGFLFLYDDP